MITRNRGQKWCLNGCGKSVSLTNIFFSKNKKMYECSRCFTKYIKDTNEAYGFKEI